MSRVGAFVDLDDIVTMWAWKRYDKNPTRKQNKLKSKKQVNVVIDWSKVEFTDQTTRFDKIPDDEEDKPKKPDISSQPDASILFKTEFKNNTTAEQQYTFKAEKTTRSTCDVTMEKGYTHGIETGIKLALPGDVLEANAGFKREVSVTETTNETIEEEVTWGVDSTITVPKDSTTNAKLVVIEQKYNGKFEVTSRIRGWIYVTFTNMKDNNSLIMAVGDDIAMIIKRHQDSGHQSSNLTIEEDDTVVIKSEGTCKFRFGVEQKVEVNHNPMGKTPK